MSNQLFYKYYDLIFAEKDYAFESATILAALRSSSPGTVTRILDVGCGTGAHAREFHNLGVEVFGVDTDPAAIEAAEKNSKGSFACLPVQRLDQWNFHGAVSLFNVINYITDEGDLLSFFSAISERMAPKTAFLADAWNGEAALLDPPREKSTEIDAPPYKISVHLEPGLDRARELVNISMSVRVLEGGQLADDFKTSYRHRLWRSGQIADIAEQAGFRAPRVCKWMMPGSAAGPEDWKILYWCEKP